MKTAMVVARVSSEEQKKNRSIETQTKKCRKYMEGLDFTISHEFADCGTGKFLDRPGLNSARALAGKVDAIVFHVVDRFSRGDRLDAANLLRWFQDEGTEVYIVGMGKIDTYDEDQMDDVYAQLRQAAKERENIVRRTSDGNRERVDAGKVLGRKRLKYGFDYDPQAGMLKFNHIEAPWVVKIFKWHAYERLGFLAIANRLQELAVPTKFDNLGIPKKKGGRCKWDLASIGRIVIDPIYRGVWTWGKKNTEKTPLTVQIPAMIDPELWELAQEVSRKNRKRNSGGKKHDGLLSGIATCSCCGRPFYQSLQRERRLAYECYGQRAVYSPDGKTILCHGAFDAELVDLIVWNAIENVLREPDKLILGYQQRQKEKIAQIQPDKEYLSRLRAEVDALDFKRANYVKALGDGVIPHAELYQLIDGVNKDKQERIDKIGELEERLNTAALGTLTVEKFEALCERIVKGIDLDQLTPTDKIEIMRALDITVTIHRREAERKGNKKTGRGSATISGLIRIENLDIAPEVVSVNLSTMRLRNDTTTFI